SLREILVQIDDQAPVKLDGRQESAWTVPLSLLRRRSQVRVQVQTFEEQPQIVSRSLTVRVVPPAPAIASFAIAERTRDEESCLVTATIKANPPDRKVTINLVHNDRRVKNLKAIQGREEWQIEQKIALVEGVNWLTLEAVNDGAEEPYLREESVART